jgi:hypothetical protein
MLAEIQQLGVLLLAVTLVPCCRNEHITTPPDIDRSVVQLRSMFVLLCKQCACVHRESRTSGGVITFARESLPISRIVRLNTQL